MDQHNEVSSTEQLADDFAARAVKAVLKKDVDGLVVLDELATATKAVAHPASPNASRQSGR